jgi:hypothetical protein
MLAVSSAATLQTGRVANMKTTISKPDIDFK